MSKTLNNEEKIKNEVDLIISSLEKLQATERPLIAEDLENPQLLPVNHKCIDDKTPILDLEDCDEDKILETLESIEINKNLDPSKEFGIDLRGNHIIYDQENTKACSAYAVTGMLNHLHDLYNHQFKPSTMFMYYIARILRGTLNKDPSYCKTDKGCFLSDVLWGLSCFGVCEDLKWPTIKDNVCVQPNIEAYHDALQHLYPVFYKLKQNNAYLLSSLIRGIPFAFTMNVGAYFHKITRITGIHDKLEEHFTGSHSMYCMGYSIPKKSYIIINSWSKKFGKDGCFYLSEELMLNQQVCYDFYVIVMEDNKNPSQNDPMKS
jgi:hypothetical protein